jgi:hypothetical protein
MLFRLYNAGLGSWRPSVACRVLVERQHAMGKVSLNRLRDRSGSQSRISEHNFHHLPWPGWMTSTKIVWARSPQVGETLVAGRMKSGSYLDTLSSSPAKK